MIGTAKLKFNTIVMEQLAPKMTSEHGIYITHDGRRQAMKSEDNIKEYLSNLWTCMWMINSNEMTIFGEPIHYYKNCSLTTRKW
jgi:hypothetical protein